MRLGSFELVDPLPELKSPQAIALLRPWIDVGNVGTMVLERMEDYYGAVEFGRLARPGNFFDFTRYRPIMTLKEGFREVTIPNTTISYAKRESGGDFLFLHLLEPHMFGEVYINSVMQVLRKFGVRRYCLVGSMYDLVPHTRPYFISGGAMGKNALLDLETADIQISNYEGPTSICHLISQEAYGSDIETMNMIVHIPQYTELDEDYEAEVAVLKVLSAIYGFPIGDTEIHKAEKQMEDIDHAVKKNHKLQSIIGQLEAHYDAMLAAQGKKENPQLSSEVEQFLKEMENKFKEK